MADISQHAKALSSLGAAKGGRARAAKLTNDERRESAQWAAAARWGGVATAKATHTGTLSIAGKDIACAVLEDGRRVLTQETFLTALGRAAKAKAGTGSTQLVDDLPPFLSADNLKPFIDSDLRASTTPILYRGVTGVRAFGYVATLLPKVCDVYLKARDAGELLKSQHHIAKACDLLVRGLATVGIVALVDEATGYQYDRSRHALEEILEAFIKDEFSKWAKRFPDDFYRELFRLKGLQFVPFPTKRPLYVGHWTNDLVYKRLAPGVLQELETKNPPNERGRRKRKHHQWLTDDIGHPKLQEHLASVITLMKASDDWDTFHKMLNRALPPYKELPLFPKDGD